MRAVSSSSARVGGWGWGVWLEARGRARERGENAGACGVWWVGEPAQKASSTPTRAGRGCSEGRRRLGSIAGGDGVGWGRQRGRERERTSERAVPPLQQQPCTRVPLARYGRWRRSGAKAEQRENKRKRKNKSKKNTTRSCLTHLSLCFARSLASSAGALSSHRQPNRSVHARAPAFHKCKRSCPGSSSWHSSVPLFRFFASSLVCSFALLERGSLLIVKCSLIRRPLLLPPRLRTRAGGRKGGKEQ